ncbi:MAG: hypothetical protein ACR2K5_12995 [Pseudolabrys sp.]
MALRGLVAGSLLLLCGASSASAAMLISEDRGGQIGHYLQTFAMLRSSGERVVIDGNCLSACTLVLGLIPRERICATSRARLGFHAAWMPDESGRPVTSPMGTQALWNIYPGQVQHWISRHGGLSRKMIFLQGRELAHMVPACGERAPPAIVRSTRRVAPELVRYQGANASGRRN